MIMLDIARFLIVPNRIIMFGSSFDKKFKSFPEFNPGNNKLPAWAITQTIFADLVKSKICIALSGQIYPSKMKY